MLTISAISFGHLAAQCSYLRNSNSSCKIFFAFSALSLFSAFSFFIASPFRAARDHPQTLV
jgi:hypothetical protein